MPLKLEVGDLNEVEESQRSFYVEKEEGGYKLDLEEKVVPKQKLDEFRTNNINIKTELDSIKSTLQGIDVDTFNKIAASYKETLKQTEDEKTKKLIEEGNIEELVNIRAERMKTDYETKLQERQTQADKYRQALEESKIAGELSRIAAQKGIQEELIDDVILRGKQVFKLTEDLQVQAVKGGQPVFNKDNKPYSMEEFVSELPAPFFKESRGGGADNTTKGKGSKTGNTIIYRGREHQV